MAIIIDINAAKQICGTVKSNTKKRQAKWWNEALTKGISNKNNYWRKDLKQKNKVKIILEAKQKSGEEFGRKVEENK